MGTIQLTLLETASDGSNALDYFSESDGETRGEVFTKAEVVNFILDLV